MKNFLSALLLAIACSTGQAQEVFKIAMIDPLSGPMADIGRIFENHLRFAADQINSRGGINGIKLEVSAYDNKLSAAESATALQVAVGAGVKVVFVGGGSAAVAAIVTAANRNNERNPNKLVLVFNYGGFDPDLVGKNCSFWHFLTDAQVPMRMKAMVDFVGKRPDIKKVYFINPDYSFGRQWAAYGKSMLAAARPDIEFVGEDYFQMGAVKDFSPYIAKIRAAGADTVVSGNWGNDMALMVRAAGDSGLKLNVLTHGVANKGTMIALSVAKTVKLSMVGDWYPGSDNNVVKNLAASFEEKYKEAFYLARLSVGTELLANGIAAAKSTDPLKIALALEGISYKSMIGDVTMRKKDHQFLLPQIIYTSHPVDGKAVKMGFDGTDYGFVKESESSAKALEVPNTCNMKRPSGT
jgi:branched-chain amino acid transport system substrate-binding protein